MISYICTYVHTYVVSIDPPAINSITVDELCSNDFTISWTITGDDTGVSYTVTLISSGLSGLTVTTMNTSHNVTRLSSVDGLTPNTSYDVEVVSIAGQTCMGVSATTTATTSTREAAVPRSKS